MASVLGALAVMGGGALLLLALKRRYGASWRPAAGRIEILGRAGLGPSQGLALVRVGTRVFLVSSGEGGARTLAELSPEELDGPLENLEDPPQAPVRAPARPSWGWSGGAVLKRAAASARRAGLGIALVLLAGHAGGLGRSAGPNGLSRSRRTPGPRRSTSSFLRCPCRWATARRASGLTGTVGTVIVLGLLALAPTLVLLTSSFTRILVVLHLLRQALGTQTTPPGHLLAGLALLLSGVVMTPTLEQVRLVAFDPWMAGEIDEGTMLGRAAGPMRMFMLEHAREEDLRTFLEISRSPAPASPEDISNTVLMSAFVTSELRAAFEIGFALFLPFVVIDLVVAAILTSMGMFMLPPTMIALPCKLLLFVLMDGWSLLLGALAQSFV